jgi:hypothetical protein
MQTPAININHYLSVWRADLVNRWVQNGWGVWSWCMWCETKGDYPSHLVYMTVFHAEIFAILACARDCIETKFAQIAMQILSP